MVKTTKKDNSGAILGEQEEFDKLWDNTMEEQYRRPSYYAVLPAEVRYNNHLTHFDKIMYGEITALSNKLGYCYATNKYFSQLYNNSEQTVSRSINNLFKQGFIFTLIEGVYRRIYINTTTTDLTTLDKNVKIGSQKCLAKGSQKCRHNNTSNNNINNNNDTSKPKEKKGELSDTFGKNYIARLVEIYHLAWKHKLGIPCYEKVGGRTGAILKRLKKDFTEYEIACMIFLHFEWKGVNNDSPSINKRLSDNCFPLGWIEPNVTAYQTFIKEKLGIKSSKQLQEHVDKAIAVCRGAV